MKKIDFLTAICGFWKRNLEVRNFGGLFQHLKVKFVFFSFSSKSYRNEVILVEEIRRKENTQNIRFIRWSFGKTTKVNELQFAYEMKVNLSSNNLIKFEWKQEGSLCYGTFYPSTNMAILHFNTKKTLATVTYSFIDDEKMSVVIVEMNKEKNKKTMQYGNLFKIKQL